MKERMKNLASLSLAKELTKNEQKKIRGGELCSGYVCTNTSMTCTQTMINNAYCMSVWHSNAGVSTCTYSCF
jgi:hypothetical protein